MLHFAVLCHAALAAIPPPSFLPGGPWSLAWHDEFDSPQLNESWWNVGTLKGANGDLIPGAYGAYRLNWKHLDYVSAEDVLVSDGALQLRNQKRVVQGTDPVGQFNYTAGWVHTMHKVSILYGYVEARIRFPLGTKVHPAFWALEEDLKWGAEWDIAEYYGTPWRQACHSQRGASAGGADTHVQHVGSADPAGLCCSLCSNAAHRNLTCAAAVYNATDSSCHFKASATGPSTKYSNATTLVPAPGGLMQNLHDAGNKWSSNPRALCDDPSASSDPSGKSCSAASEWHTYGLRWGPAANGYDWIVDGEVVQHVDGAATGVYPATKMYFVLNNGVPFEKDPAPAAQTPFPNTMEIDYVRWWTEGK